MKLASFDIELATLIPDGNRDWDTLGNIGISCAAIALSDQKEVEVFKGDPVLDNTQSEQIVEFLQELQSAGYGIVTWSGCAFDFPILAKHSGKLEQCARLALRHYDLMLFVTFQKGWYLALEKALLGAGLKGKLKEIHLSDGTILDNMDGSMAPELWSKGERDAVIEYLIQDVTQQLELAVWISKHHKICWESNSGNPWSLPVPKLHTVEDCFAFPQPDVSWMDDPPVRSQFTDWMPPKLQP